MNKDQLQQEILTKVKPGIKPSDLKKQRGKSSQIPTPPPTPPLKPTKTSLSSKPEEATIPPKTPEKPLIKPFYCPACRTTKKATPIYLRVAQTDSEYNLVRGKTYSFCSPCSPKIKEFNEYDLITPELWDKYPYSEANEILELEFGIKRKEET